MTRRFGSMAAAMMILSGLMASAIAGAFARDGHVPSTGSSPARSSTSIEGRVALPDAGVAVLFADLDGDGREDPVVVYGRPDGECTLARVVRTGDALGLRPLTTPSGAPLHAPALGDADQDGTPDLIEASSGRVQMWRGLGSGTFASEPKLLYASDDLILPEEGCARAPAYLQDVECNEWPELVLPVAGGVRVVPINPMGCHLPGEAAVDGSPRDLLTQPSVVGGQNALALRSALPVSIGSGGARILVLGPISDPGSRRLELSWWVKEEDGRLHGRRSALALPAGERAFMTLPCDLEGDGRPEIAVLTAPVRLQKLLGEFALRVYRASDTADAPVQPFFSATTNINYWQGPSMAVRPGAGGGDLLIAFYRGLVNDHLNVAIYRSDGSGALLPHPREIGLDVGKKPNEGLLLWKDVDGDGTLDLVAGDDKGLRIHRGLADRDAPLETSPSRGGSLTSSFGQTRSLSLSLSGSWSISFSGPPEPVFRDLDGDGLAEAIVIERTRRVRGRGQNVDALSIGRLVPSVR